ncbi:MAG: hypothetical protein ABI824_07560 [Acidobacteriota bacterium]
MQRITMKTSTIFIGKGDRTQVFHSVNDVPHELRQELEASTNGFNSATILIADRRGRQEIIRALNGLPTGLRTRLSTSLQAGTEHAESSSTGALQATSPEASATGIGITLPSHITPGRSLARFLQRSSRPNSRSRVVEVLDAMRAHPPSPKLLAAILIPAAIGLLAWLALSTR